MHAKDKARILKTLEGHERKSTVAEVGAAQDYWTLNEVMARSRLNRVLPRSEVIAVINEWAGYIAPPSRILEHMKKIKELEAKW